MKRLHLQVSAPDLDRAIGFYATLFGTVPSVRQHDYAKWMLEDPRVNYALSTRSKRPGLDHLGIQVDAPEDLGDIAKRLRDACEAAHDQVQAACCYARSDKTRTQDPAGLTWETFHTTGQNTTYGEGHFVAPAPAPAKACCGG